MIVNYSQMFDIKKKLQYLNNESSVMHCHHYATLYTKMALETEDLGGPGHLEDSSEEAFYITLRKYKVMQNIQQREDIRKMCEEYFSMVGLGKISITISGSGGSIIMSHSHIDEGWVKKWGRSHRKINFVGSGYIKACFSLIFDKDIRTFDVEETRSIVKGDSVSEFKVFTGGNHGN